MIWALLAIYILGGGGAGGAILTADAVEQMSERVQMVIEDPTRAQMAEENLDALHDEIEAFNEIYSDSGKELEKLYSDHESSSYLLLVALVSLNTKWDAAQKRGLDLRFELRDSLPQAEWSKIVGGE